MRPSTSQLDGRHRVARLAIMPALIAIVAAVALPASASAAPCPVVPGNATSWIGGSGSLHDDAKWTNGTPSGSCDVSITAPGSYTVTMTAGANTKSLTLGGVGSTPHLVISDQSPNTNLDAQPAGITIAAGATVELTCQVGGCPGGGPDIYSGPSPFSNAGVITVGANTGGGAVVGGQITNTGTIDFDQSGSLSGKVTNTGSILVADGATATNQGSSCGDTGALVKNDTGGLIDGGATGVLSVRTFEQGAGTTRDVRLPCGGTLSYTGSGASEIRATGGFNLTGEMQAGQALTISSESNNTTAFLQSDFTNKGSITLTCPPSPGSCNGGSGGGAGFSANGKSFTNAGTFTVATDSGTGAGLSGGLTNTGTMTFNQTASMGGIVINKGAIAIADTKVVTNAGGSCGDTGAVVKNETGGSIDGGATGVLSVRNFEQGAGSSKDVTIPCGGTLHYSGSGSSDIRATGGFNLTGEMQAGQALTISAEGNNTNASLQSNFTNNGSITLTCPPSPGECNGGPGGGVGFNVNDKDFVNAGEFLISAASGTGASVGANHEGTLTNTGTMTFDQSARLNGPVTNQGAIDIATGKVAISSGGSCGDSAARVKNDTGGSINGTGSGHLQVNFYEQGNGTTSGATPVRINCGGGLTYSGSGASTVVVDANPVQMTGNIAAGQTLRIVNQVNSGAFTNAGTIILDQSGSNPTLNTGTVTNTGKIETFGPSANTSAVSGGQVKQTGAGAEIVVPNGTKLSPGAPLKLEAGTLRGAGTIAGAVENTGGVVKPGDSPGTLTLTGSYVQGVGGRLEIEIAGTGAGLFDTLAVGGVATLNGTLALLPIDGFAGSAAVGDSVSFLPYGSSLNGGFATTAVAPALPCPKQLAVSNDGGAKTLKATVTDSGASCGGGGGGGSATQNPPVNTSVPRAPERKSCPKGKQLKKGKCILKKCPKSKKLKKGRCVKKKQQPKGRSRPIFSQ